jgi:hypothetical protein
LTFPQQGEPVSGRQWARLRAEHDCPLRRGAWYPVLSLSPHEAVLDVNRQSTIVPLAYLEVVNEPPARWTVVERSKAPLRIPSEMSPTNAVCPSCQERVPLGGAPPVLRCPRCHGVFEVAWDKPYVRERD